MNNMIAGLLKKVKKNYLFLKTLSPNHELLKYFILNEQDFTANSDARIQDEFIKEFGGDIPTPECIKKNKIKIPFTEYMYILGSTLFRNYITSLEEAIQFAEMMN